MSRPYLLFWLLAGMLATPSRGDIVSALSPDIDRWNYPFNGTPATRTTAATFGAVGSDGFDNRDAEYLVGYNTAARGIPTGLSQDQYLLGSVVITATVAAGSFTYNPVADTYRSFLDPTDPDYVPPSPNGVAIELFGAGFRNGYSFLEYNAANPSPPGFKQATAFAPPGPPAADVRNVFTVGVGTGGSLIDASNNVTDRIDVTAFAVGKANLAPGSLVPEQTVFTFTLDLSQAAIVDYVQEGLRTGSLGFVLSSLHPATFGGDATYPIFFTKFNALPGATFTTLTIDYQAVPEAGSLALVGLGAVGLGLASVRRRMNAKK